MNYIRLWWILKPALKAFIKDTITRQQISKGIDGEIAF